LLPQQDYNQALLWVISWKDFISSVLGKKGYGGGISAAIGRLAGPILAARDMLKQRRMLRRRSNVEFLQPSEVTSEFDAIWESLTMERPDRFLARRDCISLKWQFGHPAAASRQPIVLCSRVSGALKGYTILTRWDSPAWGLRRMMVTDLIALNNDEDVIGDLISAAYRYARDERVHVIQMIGFPPFIREIMEIFKPIKRLYPVSPFWYFTRDAEVAADLTRPEAWYASMMDGDSTL
jgi:hypothetical protein